MDLGQMTLDMVKEEDRVELRKKTIIQGFKVDSLRADYNENMVKRREKFQLEIAGLLPMKGRPNSHNAHGWIVEPVKFS